MLPGSTSERPPLPVYIYKTTTRAPRPEVIQHIPRLRPTPGSISTEPTESGEVTNPRRQPYASLLPRKSSTPNYISLRPITPPTDENEESTGRPSVIQVIRPKGFKKVLVTKRPLDASTTAIPYTSTEFYPTTYGEEEGVQRQIDSNTVTEVGLAASGTEDSPDVFGGGPTARPYPAAAYRTLFNPLPQYQRILQTSFLQNQNQYLTAGAEGRGPPPVNGPGYGPYGNQPPIPNRFQDPAAIAQFAQISPRAQALPGGQNLPYPGDAGRQGLPPGGQNLQYPGDLGRQGLAPGGQNLPYPGDLGRQGLAPNGQNLPYPGDLGRQGLLPGGQNLPYPVDPARQGLAPNVQNLPYPVDPGRQGIPGRQGVLPPGFQNPREQLPYPQPENVTPYPQDPNINPQPQTLPPSGYNPAQGLPPPNPEDSLRRQPPIPPPYSPDQANPQTYIMEQLIRMLLAAQMQARPQQQLSPFQQALISTLGLNNVPQDFLPNRNYDPRYPYPNYQPRQPYYPPYDPRYPYQNYQDPYAPQSPYQNRYNQYYGPNPYQAYNPYQGYSQNPLYQYPPEEALLRMFLGQRYPPPVPQPSPQIQQSPSAFDRSPQYAQQVQQNPGQVFGQRIPIVERSPYPQREASSERSTVYTRRPPSSRGKGSRNVQIVEEPTASASSTTTSKPS